MKVIDTPIEFIYLEGLNSDYTTEHKVIFPEHWTVRNFIEYIVSDFSINSEYHSGEISIYKATNYFDGATYQVIEYANGKGTLAPTDKYLSEARKQELQSISKKILEESLDNHIKKVIAYESIHTMRFTLYV